MGLRGPAPTPTRILEARGSRRAGSREGEVVFAAGRPSCPPWLGAEAKAEWRRQVRHLEAAGILVAADRAVLAAYCEAWGEFRELVEAVRALGGAAAAWRLVKLKNAAAERAARLAQQFGFSPSARARVRGPEAEDQGGGGKARYFAG